MKSISFTVQMLVVWSMVFSVIALSARGQETSSSDDSSGRVFQDKDSPVAFGVQTSLESLVLKEKRTLNIYLPPSYASSPDKTYPTIYLLDGGVDEDYHHQTGLVQFLVMYQLMPESIVVGIANTDRKRDMTHPTTDLREKRAIPTSGGSANFIKFIETELQPFINKKYRTGDETTLIGQSLGALFATEVLIERPQLFENYVIVSPSLYWSDLALVKRFEAFLKANQELDKKIFLSIGTEPDVMHQTMDTLVKNLTELAPKSVKWKYSPLPNETHATVMHRATYQAYEFFYGDTHKGL